MQILASVDDRNEVDLAIGRPSLAVFIIYASCLHDAKEQREGIMFHKIGIKEVQHQAIFLVIVWVLR